MNSKKINICIIGTGPFARPFIRCYQRHPYVGDVSICSRNKKRLDERADMLNIPTSLRFTSYEHVLKDPNIDAVHILTPTFEHAKQELLALKAGKHVATAVSMGETLEELQSIVNEKRKSGKTFMLMETSAYSRDILKAKKMIKNGELGRIQFISGSHMQNTHLINLEERWNGYPPMLYGSHACIPLYALTGKLAESVICLGSGDIGSELTQYYGCKDAYQTCLVTLRDSDIKGEIHRTMFHALRQMREHFDVYGSLKSYEWEQLLGEGAAIFTDNASAHREQAEDMTNLLPDSLVYKGALSPASSWHFADVDTLEYALRLGHNGSYPHLIHEFISAIFEERDSYLDAEVAANITAIGICAVESAKQDGEKIKIPIF
ncbi:MAG: Gfo/Idh/MocA family protein [Suipraeoptans sp.]